MYPNSKRFKRYKIEFEHPENSTKMDRQSALQNMIDQMPDLLRKKHICYLKISPTAHNITLDCTAEVLMYLQQYCPVKKVDLVKNKPQELTLYP